MKTTSKSAHPCGTTVIGLLVVFLFMFALPGMAADSTSVKKDTLGFNLTPFNYNFGFVGSVDRVFTDASDLHLVGVLEVCNYTVAISKTEKLRLSPLVTFYDLHHTAQAGILIGTDLLDVGWVWNKKSRQLYVSSSWPIEKVREWLGLKKTLN